MNALKKGKRVRVFIHDAKGRWASQFHSRKGTVAYRTPNNSSRYFVHLDGDPSGIDTEFLRSELRVV